MKDVLQATLVAVINSVFPVVAKAMVDKIKKSRSRKRAHQKRSRKKKTNRL